MKFFSNILPDITLLNAIKAAKSLGATDELPNSCRLLAHLINLKSELKRLNLKGRKEMAYNISAYNLCKQLSFFDAAVKEVLRKNKNYEGKPLISFVSKDTDFTRMVCAIANKYLNYYKSEEDKYDIIIEAYQNLFLNKKNFENSLYNFDGYLYEKDPKTGNLENNTTIQIEQYIYKLLSNAVISESKKLSEEYSKRKSITPFEDESEEEAFDRAVEKKLDKYSADDALMWDTLIRDVNKQFGKEFARDKFPDRPKQILEFLLMGYNKSEIAQMMGISPTRIGDFIWYMKKAIRDLANDYSQHGDSTLLYELNKNFDKSK